MSAESMDPFASSEDTPFEPVEDRKPTRSSVVADGRKIEVPPAKELPAWAPTDDQDNGDGVDGDNPDGTIDYKDIESLSSDLLRLRVRQNKVRRAMRGAAREAVIAKLKYNRALRRHLIQQSGGSAESRKATAELLCEDLEADMVMKAQIAEEYNTLFRSVRDDVENAKVVSYNLRALL